MRLTKAEWSKQATEPGFQDRLALAIRTDGFVLLEEFYDRDRIRGMRDDFAAQLEALRSGGDGGREQSRYNIQLPVREPFVAPDIQTNEMVYPLVQRLLGEDVAVSFMAADTPLKGSVYQTAHSDGVSLFPDLDAALPVFNIVFNIMLVDFTPENGPLEIYPYGTQFLDWKDADLGSQLREPQVVLAPAGSIIVRDARMWHRGTPNRTDEMRPMMAVAFSRSWYRFGEAEVGMKTLKVDQAQYESWSPELQRLFRFAQVENDVNAPVLVETMKSKVERLLTVAGA